MRSPARRNLASHSETATTVAVALWATPLSLRFIGVDLWLVSSLHRQGKIIAIAAFVAGLEVVAVHS